MFIIAKMYFIINVFFLFLYADDLKPILSNIEEYQLDNGMNVLIAPNYDNPIVYIYLYLNVGEMDDPMNKIDLAAWTFRHMKDETDKYDRNDIKNKLFSFGNESGKFVWYGMESEFSYIENYCLKQDTRECLELMAEILINPKFSNRGAFWKKILTKIAPKHMFHNEWYLLNQHSSNLYVNTKVNFSPHKTLKLKKIDMKKWHEQHVRPENVTIVIAGDVNYIYIKKIINEYFSTWKSEVPLAEKRNYKINLNKQTGNKIRFINFKNKTDARIRIITWAPSFYDDWFMAGSLVNIVFAGNPHISRTSKIHKKFNRAGNIWTNIYHRPRTPNLSILSNTNYSDLSNYYSEIKDEFSRLANGSITEEELESAKKHRINSYKNKIYNLESFSSLINRYYNNGYGLNDISMLTDRVNQVSIEEINAAAKKMFDPNNFMMVILGNKDSCATFLEKFENYEYYEPTDELK